MGMSYLLNTHILLSWLFDDPKLIFFTIFETLMAERDETGNPIPNFGGYPPTSLG